MVESEPDYSNQEGDSVSPNHTDTSLYLVRYICSEGVGLVHSIRKV